MRDRDPTIAPPVASSLPKPAAAVRVDPPFGEQTSDPRIRFACSVPVVVEGPAEVEIVVVADAVRSLAVALEALTLLIQGLSASIAKHEDSLERHDRVHQTIGEIRAMLDQIRSWLPPPPTSEHPKLH
jgi:hypothetical protein